MGGEKGRRGGVEWLDKQGVFVGSKIRLIEDVRHTHFVCDDNTIHVKGLG